MKPIIWLIVIGILFNPGWAQDGRYTVQPGDNLSKIAKKLCGKENGRQEIQKANPEIKFTGHLPVGKELIIPCWQPAPTTETIQWTLVTAWPKDFPIFHDGCNKLAADVKVMSKGKLNIKVLALKERFKELSELFKAVSTGRVEMGHSVAFYWAKELNEPESQFFAAIPFGMTAKGSNAWLYNGGGLTLWRELYKKHNLYPFPMGNSGTQMGGWFNKRIRTISDFAGLNMRIGGFLNIEVLKMAGSNPVELSAGKIMEAFKSGKIDAAEWLGPHHDKALELYKVAKYYYYPGWHEPATTIELIINQNKWESLSDDLKKIIEVASSNINQWIYSQFESLNPSALRFIKKQDQVEVLEFPPEVLKKLREYTQQVMEREANKRPEFKKIYDSYERFRKDNDEWSKISDGAYEKIQE